MPGVVLGRLELDHARSQHIQVAANPYLSSAKATLPKTLKPKKGCDPAPVGGAGATPGHGEGEERLRVRGYDVKDLQGSGGLGFTLGSSRKLLCEKPCNESKFFLLIEDSEIM